MEIFPSRTVFLQLGSLSITWYAILSLSGFVAAYYVTKMTLKKMKYDTELFDDYFYMLLGNTILKLGCQRNRNYYIGKEYEMDCKVIEKTKNKQ